MFLYPNIPYFHHFQHCSKKNFSTLRKHFPKGTTNFFWQFFFRAICFPYPCTSFIAFALFDLVKRRAVCGLRALGQRLFGWLVVVAGWLDWLVV
jgi:hypothetical protein